MSKHSDVIISPGESITIHVEGLGALYSIYTEDYTDDQVSIYVVDDANGTTLDENDHYLE